MNNIDDLNNRSGQLFEFTDNRNAGFVFDSENAINQSITINEGGTHNIPVGIEILEIINYDTLNAAIQVDLTNAPSATTIDWGTLPSGCTETESPTGVYTVDGLDDVNIWDAIKSPEIDLGSVFNGEFDYTVSIVSDTLDPITYTVSVTVLEVNTLSNPGGQNYTRSAQNLQITTPDLVDTGGDGINWTIEIDVVDFPEAIDEITTTSTQGSLSWNNSTKTATITGNNTQVNDILDNLYINIASVDLTWTMRYESYNDTNSETDIITQTWTSTSTDILGTVRSDPTFTEDQDNSISGGPLITSSQSGQYNEQIYAYPSNTITNMKLSNFRPTYTVGTTFLEVASNGNQWEYLDSYSYHQNNISSDDTGDRVAFGLNTGDSGNGAVYVLKQDSNGDYDIETTITKTGVIQVGFDVHLNTDGDLLHFTVRNSSSYQTTSVFTYTRSGTTWTQANEYTGTISSSYDPANKLKPITWSHDGEVMFVEDGQDLNVLTWTGSGWSLRDQVYTNSDGSNVTYGQMLTANGDGTVFATVGYGKKAAANLTQTTGGFDIYRWNGSSYVAELDVELGYSFTSDYLQGGTAGYLNAAGDAFITAIIPTGSGSSPGGNTSTFKYYRYASGSWSEKQGFTDRLGINPERQMRLSPDGLLWASYYGVRRYDVENNTWSSESNFSDVTTIEAIEFTKDSKSVFTGTETSTASGEAARLRRNDPSKFVSYDSTTDVLTLSGTRSGLNALIDTITMTPSSGTQPDIQLIYEVTTPNGTTTKKNQTITNVT